MQTPQLPPKLAQAAKLANEFILEAADSVTDATAQLEQLKIDINAANTQKAEAVHKAKQTQRAAAVVIANAKKEADTAKKEAQHTVAANLDALNDSKILLADIEEQVTLATNTLEKRRDEQKLANNELGNTYEQIEQAKAELEEIRKKAAAENAERQKHDEKLSDIKTAIATAKAELKTLQKNCATLQKEIADAQVANKAEIKEHSHKIRQAVATLEELQQRRETVEQQIQKFEEHLQTERKQLDADKKHIARQKAELAKGRRRLSSDESLLRPLT